MMPSYNTSSNKLVVLGAKLDSGAEGDVFMVSGDDSLVAKIYKPEARTAEQEEKLRVMLAAPPHDGTRGFSSPHISIAWPTDILYEHGALAGFLMPRIGQSHKIFEVYNPQSRKSVYPGFDWRYLHRTARNLVTAVNALHTAGYVIGDVNQKNVFVAGSALISLIDTDSFQVRAPDGRVYRCMVGVPDYTPPELLGVNLKDVDREPANDCFGLAVMIFHLLMEGYHPFGGAQRDTSISIYGPIYLHCIRQGIFPYNESKDFKPPPGAPAFKSLPPVLQELFLRCFVQGHWSPNLRPTARQWMDALTAAEDSLKHCTLQSSHWYSPHYGSCHWCEREKQATAARVKSPSQRTATTTQTPLPNLNPGTTRTVPAATPRVTTTRATSSQAAIGTARRATPTTTNVSRYAGLVAAGVLGLMCLTAILMWFVYTRSGSDNNSPTDNSAVASRRAQGSGNTSYSTTQPSPLSQRNSATTLPQTGATADDSTTARDDGRADLRTEPLAAAPRSANNQPSFPSEAHSNTAPITPPPEEPTMQVRAASYLNRANYLFQQENFDAAYAAAEEGLRVDPANSGLQSLRQRIETARRLLSRRSSMPSATTESPQSVPEASRSESSQSGNHRAAIKTKPPLVARVSGTVWVAVTVDAEGNVVSAQAVSGPSELKQAAVEAARQSKFRPAIRQGVPVSDTLRLPYMFSARN